MRLRSDGTLQLSPSDLSAHLSCRHLTTLALEVARGERKASYTREELAQLIAEKGEAHERAYLDRLIAAGRDVVEIELPQEGAHSSERTTRRSRPCVAAPT